MGMAGATFHSALIKLPAHLFCLPTYRTQHWPVGSGGRSQPRSTTIRRLLSQSSSQTPLAHSQYAKNVKALTMPRKERAQFVGTHSCPNVAARLPTYWLSSPVASVRALATSARVNCCDAPNSITTTRRPCAFSPCGFSSSSNFWDDGDFRSVLSAIEWCVC